MTFCGSTLCTACQICYEFSRIGVEICFSGIGVKICPDPGGELWRGLRSPLPQEIPDGTHKGMIQYFKGRIPHFKGRMQYFKGRIQHFKGRIQYFMSRIQCFKGRI